MGGSGARSLQAGNPLGLEGGDSAEWGPRAGGSEAKRVQAGVSLGLEEGEPAELGSDPDSAGSASESDAAGADVEGSDAEWDEEWECEEGAVDLEAHVHAAVRSISEWKARAKSACGMDSFELQVPPPLGSSQGSRVADNPGGVRGAVAAQHPPAEPPSGSPGMPLGTLASAHSASWGEDCSPIAPGPVEVQSATEFSGSQAQGLTQREGLAQAQGLPGYRHREWQQLSTAQSCALPGVPSPQQHTLAEVGKLQEPLMKPLVVLPPLMCSTLVPASQLADPAILSYFQLVESIWEEEHLDGITHSQLGTRDSTARGGAPSPGTEDCTARGGAPSPGTFSNTSMESPATMQSTSLSHTSHAQSSAGISPTGDARAESVRGLSPASTPTGRESSSAGPQWGRRLKPARRVPSAAPAFLDSTCAMVQIPAADPQVLEYFEYVEAMLERRGDGADAIVMAGDSSQGGLLSATNGTFESTLSLRQGDLLSASHGGYRQVHTRASLDGLPGGEVPRCKTTPQHRVSASEDTAMKRPQSVTGSSESHSGLQASAKSADFESDPRFGSFRSSPIRDALGHRVKGPECPPWRRPQVTHLLGNPEDPLPPSLAGTPKDRTAEKSRSRPFMRRLWRGLR